MENNNIYDYIINNRNENNSKFKYQDFESLSQNN